MGLRDELGLRNPIEEVSHEAVLNVVRTGELLTKECGRVLRPFHLTDSQFNVLMLLRYQSDNGSLDQTSLGRMLLVNRSNITGLIDRMEQAGWVTRNARSGDRRVRLIRLTRAGHRILERAEQAYFGRLQELMKALSAAEQRRLCRVLERIRGRARNGPKAANRSSPA